MEHITVKANDLPLALQQLEDRGDVTIVAVVPSMLAFFAMWPKRYEVSEYKVFWVKE
jgi:hypothetical protein